MQDAKNGFCIYEKKVFLYVKINKKESIIFFCSFSCLGLNPNSIKINALFICHVQVFIYCIQK